jgi:hypothetical protein
MSKLSANIWSTEIRLLRKFLRGRKSSKFLKSFRIKVFANQLELKSAWGKTDLSKAVRSHKKIAGLGTLVVEIEKNPGCGLGFDLESLAMLTRPLFVEKRFLQKRFRVSRNLSSPELLQQWILREAAFKALYPNNFGVVLSQFKIRKKGPRFLIAGPQKSKLVGEIFQSSKLVAAFVRFTGRY